MKNNQILQGEALSILKGFRSGQFDGIITDPPYSSGGANNRDKLKSTAQKYTGTKEHCPYPDFEGDTKDQRSWTNWAAQWLGECRRVAKPGTPICVFTDWRQLPSLTDALQWAGWIWRGVVPWDKKIPVHKRDGFAKMQSLWFGAVMAVWILTALYLFCRGVIPLQYQALKPVSIKRKNHCL